MCGGVGPAGELALKGTLWRFVIDDISYVAYSLTTEHNVGAELRMTKGGGGKRKTRDNVDGQVRGKERKVDVEAA